VPVSLYTSSPLIWGIHVPPGSGFTQIADLPGARFGISRYGSGSHLMTLALAIEHAWSVDALRFVIVDDLPGAARAFAADQADVFLWEHFTTQPAVDAGLMCRIGDFSAPWPAWVICARRNIWQQWRPLVERLVQIVADQASELAASPDAAGVIAGHFGLELVAVREWLKLTRWVDGMVKPDKALATARQMLERAGAIS